jgi:hypothetical protein
MKKNILFAFLIIVCLSATAQRIDTSDVSKIDALKEYREELFKSKLPLSDKEAKAFFPIYDQYQLELRNSKREFRKKWYKKDMENLSESEAREYLNDAIALQQKEVELLKNYSNKMGEVIPMNKVIKVKRVEREIRDLLIDKANEMDLRKSGRKPRGKHPKGHRPPPPPMDEP